MMANKFRGRPLKILVCGGRDFHYKGVVEALIESTCYDLHDVPGSVPWSEWSLICGMAKGVDTLAYEWASKAGMPVEKYPALWEEHGRSAGYIRNKLMLEDGQPDVVIAFPGGRGTAMMVEIAEKAGVEVINYD